MATLLCLECTRPYEADELGDERCETCRHREAKAEYKRQHSRHRYHEVIKADPYLLNLHRERERRRYHEVIKPDPERAAKLREANRERQRRVREQGRQRA